ncbi:MAG: autotransporter outer membrane beta-barrel domain-containing protein [Rickettsiales bacterium]|jgi:outer membrane autotransporter protein|nr:autotransporter outer membrane beta-barrel domain-containing protein [Rickettsiales bacterium]
MKHSIFFTSGAFCIALLNGGAHAATATQRIDLTSGQTDSYDGATLIGLSAPGGVGGAIYNAGGTLTIGDGAVFEDNYSSTMGGIIFNVNSGAVLATTTIGNNAAFLRNKTFSYGGVMNVSGSTLNIGNNARFINNETIKADSIGAAILNQEAVMNIGDNVLFQGNKSLSSGAAIYQQVRGGALNSQIEIGDNAVFQGNSSASAAAIYNFNNGTDDSIVSVGDNSRFRNNNASSARGGAIGNWFGTFDVGAGAAFDGNTAATAAGAVISEGYMTFQGASSFLGNSSQGYAGALANINEYGHADAYVNFDGAAVFMANSAAANGGAIVNQVIMNFNDAATFINNRAGTHGGAIDNTGTLNFLGDATFSGNQANGALNDIANGGAVSFANGTNVVFDGGITNTAAGSSITFGDDMSLSVKLSAHPFINADTITVGSNTAISGLIIGAGAVGDNIALTHGTMTGDFVFDSAGYANAMYSVTYNGNGLFAVAPKTVAQIAAVTGRTSGELTAAQAVIAGASSNARFATIQDAVAAMLQSNDAATFDQGIAAVATLAPTVAPVTQANSTQTTNQVLGAVGGRFSGGGGSGMSSGDIDMGDVTIWATGIYNKAKLNTENGFDSKSSGIAVGLEVENQEFKLGAGYARTSTDVSAVNRDTDIKSDAVILYGQYKPNEWYANFVGGYIFADNEETKNVAGVSVTGGNDVDTIALQLMGGYEYNVFQPYIVETVSPEIGLRWMNINAEKYIDSAGTVVESDRNNILTAVAKIKMDAVTAVNNWLLVKPKVSFGVTYDFVRDDAQSVVTLANGSVFSVVGDALGRLGGEVEAGLHFLAGPGLDLSLSYEGKFREHYTDHTGVLDVRYKF